MGLEVRLVPLFTIVPVGWTAPDPSEFDALVLTSANAVRYGGEELDRLKALPVHAVGEATAAAAREAGFAIASVGKGGGGDLRPPDAHRLLHLTGHNHVHLDADLTIPIYDARQIDTPAELNRLDGCVVAVHSPRAGRRLAELIADRSRIAVAAISEAAALACGAGWEVMAAAPQPTDDALLALAARLCESPRP
jgi:uroporphyrinogen-III synthase